MANATVATEQTKEEILEKIIDAQGGMIKTQQTIIEKLTAQAERWKNIAVERETLINKYVAMLDKHLTD